jgi:hypothetical protein
MAFESLTDEQLLAQVRRTADRCVSVMQLPLEERQACHKKGSVSPEQAGLLSAWFTILAHDECVRRGLSQPSF